MSKYYDKYNLLLSKPDYPNTEENSYLWSVEEYYLMKLANISTEAHISVLRQSLSKMKLAPGLYAQNPLYSESEPNSKSKYMSRDQLMAIMSISHEMAWEDRKDIWKVIKFQYFTYNNIEDGKIRWITPFDLSFYMYCVNVKYKQLVIGITSLACIISCFSKNESTSGKLLTFLRCQTLKDSSIIMKLTWKLCNFIINKKYTNGWKDVFKIYFPHSDHPLRLLAEKAFN